MRKHLLRTLVIALLLTTAIGQRAAAEPQTPPVCLDNITGQGLTATKWLDEPGTLVGTTGRDVLVGSAGSDVIRGLSGDDVICTDPTTAQYPDPDVVYAGSGNDSIFGVGRLYGESGDDAVYEFGNSGRADGGSGNDTLTAFALLIGGDFGVTVYGGSGDDVVISALGVDLVDCGSGRDVVEQYQGWGIKNCEHVPDPA